MNTTTAIILVGGRGTRLGSLTDNTPKPLLPVAGRSFIFHVLDFLARQGIKRVILGTGYLGHMFVEAIGSSYRNMEIIFEEEKEPLGTGGAILGCMKHIEDKAFVLNGDTLFDVGLEQMENAQERMGCLMVLAARQVPDVSRYGALQVRDGLVVSMNEKLMAGPGFINGGIYLVAKSLFDGRKVGDSFSFEHEVMPDLARRLQLGAIVQNSYFRDIGIPADLSKANEELRIDHSHGSVSRLKN
jgi:D-glycero-alpha-D-manno-heptose 1-phosphate guanylyltransferase